MKVPGVVVVEAVVEGGAVVGMTVRTKDEQVTEVY